MAKKVAPDDEFDASDEEKAAHEQRAADAVKAGLVNQDSQDADG